jgi:hypothetical protein
VAKPPDPLTVALSHEIATNPTVQSRVSRIMDTALDEAEKLIITGSPDVKMRLIDKVLTLAVKQAGQVKSDDGLGQIRQEQEAMRAQMEGFIRDSAGNGGIGMVHDGGVHVVTNKDGMIVDSP